jgi:hypothetical protein
MKLEVPIQELLRWRLARAETEAPPAPRAARLLELARPWWETWPERFKELVTRLSQVEVAYGHAMADSRRISAENLVPTIIVRSAAEIGTSARVLYFSARDGQLRLRFQLDTSQDCSEPAYEATFVSRTSSQPLFSTHIERSANGEYSMSESLSEELANEWELLKATDPMPFRLILRPPPKNDGQV